MEKNKTSRYLKYAIGEIILVVIGILIALQINNWNENRKSYKEEKETIELLLRDLSVEKGRLIFYKNELNKQEQAIINLLNAINTKESIDSVHKHIDVALDNYVFKPFKPIYQGLIQNGKLDIIRKQELRDFLVNQFEETNNYLITLINTHDRYFYETKDILDYYFPKKYTSDKTWKNSKTNNSKNVFQDSKVIQLLGTQANSKNWLSHRIDTYFIVRSDSLSNSLKGYLKTLDE